MTKLSDDAKGKLEDRTLNIDQALVLADFTDDDAATQRLLKVADRPSEWAFQLAKEQKRAWLENLPRLTAELQGAGVDIIDRPEGQTWQWTDWRVAYQPMTVAEAVADGWSAICDTTDPEITWVKERTKPNQYTAPERTPEQAAAEVREQELTRGLATAAEVRTQVHPALHPEAGRGQDPGDARRLHRRALPASETSPNGWASTTKRLTSRKSSTRSASWASTSSSLSCTSTASSVKCT